MDAFFMWKWAFSNLNQVCKTIAMIAKQYTGVFVRRRLGLNPTSESRLFETSCTDGKNNTQHYTVGLRCTNDHHLK